MLTVGFEQIKDFVQLASVDHDDPSQHHALFLDHSCPLRGLILLSVELFKQKVLEFTLSLLCIIKRSSSIAHRYRYCVSFDFQFPFLKLVIALMKSCFDLHVQLQRSFLAGTYFTVLKLALKYSHHFYQNDLKHHLDHYLYR